MHVVQANMNPANMSPDDAPPAYSSLPNAQSPEKSDMILAPQENEPGLAVASALRRGLQVSARSTVSSSAFDYPEELACYGVSREDWAQFTQTISQGAKLSRQQWTTVIGRSMGALGVGGLMIGVLGAIPAVFIARLSKRRQEQRNLISAMAGVDGDHLAQHITQWNETFFRPRGILIRIDLPDEYLDDLDHMDISKNGALRDSRKDRAKASQSARIVIIPLNETTPTCI
ncbi:unnamed protein product [Penicillium olsonii]|nr:unnamed protein product [Penicillium olsonii]